VQRFSPELLRSAIYDGPVRIEAVALAADRSVETLRAYCRGDFYPPVNILALIADATGVRVDDLFVEVDR